MLKLKKSQVFEYAKKECIEAKRTYKVFHKAYGGYILR